MRARVARDRIGFAVIGFDEVERGLAGQAKRGTERLHPGLDLGGGRVDMRVVDLEADETQQQWTVSAPSRSVPCVQYSVPEMNSRDCRGLSAMCGRATDFPRASRTERSDRTGA
jgi:hypothetical protein